MSHVRLFVYGSLKRAGRHHAELQGARFLGTAQTVPGFGLVALGPYLALVPEPVANGERRRRRTRTRQSVPGELFEVALTLLPALDAFEGDEYRRGQIALDQRNSCGFASALAYFKKAR